MLLTGVDRAIRVQQPTVQAHVARVRRGRPDASPQQVVDVLGSLYLTTVAGTGAAIGGMAAAPTVGTGAALLMSAGETVAFLESSALYTLAVAEVHGVDIEDIERRRTLLLAVLVGESGAQLVEKAAGRSAKHWAMLLPDRISRSAIEQVNTVLGRWVLRRYGAKQSVVVAGRLVPFGVGAAIGAAGNLAIGRGVMAGVQRAFGPAPPEFAVPVPPRRRQVRGEVVE